MRKREIDWLLLSRQRLVANWVSMYNRIRISWERQDVLTFYTSVTLDYNKHFLFSFIRITPHNFWEYVQFGFSSILKNEYIHEHIKLPIVNSVKVTFLVLFTNWVAVISLLPLSFTRYSVLLWFLLSDSGSYNFTWRSAI